MQTLALERTGPARLLASYSSLWALISVVGVSMGVVMGPVGVLGVLGGVVGAACAALRSRRLCRWLDRAALRKSQRARREDREARLQEAGIRVQGLVAATALVDRITASDPLLATHLELDALLDRYVVLELASARCACLLAERYGAHPVPERSMTRTRIQVRSAALRQACEMRLLALQDELASIVEFFQLVLQRSALQAMEFDADPIGERIALLDGAWTV
ncbi:MAG TPA: hypothetical protein VHN14_21785 [Kofleriaceae bacterium]|jgi:hypothetical protein|nr:hypothetical protein [Kofleriaceae bacterium]